ncbi:MAG: phosphodiester glycosidase family protein [Oscillospiraceae bacterium]|nr:phosphodiester glycosidase family protein [Oscillospiraceae bacterium]
MKKNIWAICFSAALILFSAYTAFDTFVLSESYNSNAVEMNTSMFLDEAETSDTGEAKTEAESWSESSANTGKNKSSGRKSKSKNVSSSSDSSATSRETTETSYQDENISITLTEYYQYNTKIYVADVTLTSAQYLKTAFANDTYGKNVTATTSSIASAHDAILAINGDYYGVQERGYVIRNGIVYRDTAKGADVLCIYADGTMEVVSDRDYTADELVNRGVWQAFSFGPGLIEDGAISVGVNDEVGKAKASNPRTAIGMISENHFVFVVSDGRTSESEGLSLYELAEFMQSLGVETAYNLDGGGSSTMYFNGSVINNPTTGGSIKERGVSDIVYIG